MAQHPAPHQDLAGYLFGILDPDQTDAFEAHLAACESCRAEVSDLAGLPALLAAGVPGEMPAHLWERTLARVRADGSPGRCRP